MAQTCLSCGEDNPDRARFCLACGAPLTRRPEVAERRTVVSVLFIDLVAHEDDAERAARAAFSIVDAIAELNAEHRELDLAVCGAVATGEAVVALHARPELGEGMAAGAVVNTAARQQTVAPVRFG
jgi:hypothetical protein